MKKLKFPTKHPTSVAPLFDETRLAEVHIDFRKETFSCEIRFFSDGEPAGKRAVHMGMGGTGVDFDKLEDAVLKAIGKSGILPDGGEVE